ncbi:MAG: hypothetical protein D6765_10700, partial [Bacteroidetes bacterium]
PFFSPTYRKFFLQGQVQTNGKHYFHLENGSLMHQPKKTSKFRGLITRLTVAARRAKGKARAARKRQLEARLAQSAKQSYDHLDGKWHWIPATE